MRTLVYLCFLSIMQPLKYSKIEKCQENCYMGFILQECGDFTWMVSDCEELVGSNTNLLHPFSSPPPSTDITSLINCVLL